MDYFYGSFGQRSQQAYTPYGVILLSKERSEPRKVDSPWSTADPGKLYQESTIHLLTDLDFRDVETRREKLRTQILLANVIQVILQMKWWRCESAMVDIRPKEAGSVQISAKIRCLFGFASFGGLDICRYIRKDHGSVEGDLLVLSSMGAVLYEYRESKLQISINVGTIVLVPEIRKLLSSRDR